MVRLEQVYSRFLQMFSFRLLSVISLKFNFHKFVDRWGTRILRS